MNDPVRLTICLDRPTAGADRPSATESPVTDALAGVAAGASFERSDHRAHLERKHR